MKSNFHFKCPVCDYECYPDLYTDMEPGLLEVLNHLANHIKELKEKVGEGNK